MRCARAWLGVGEVLWGTVGVSDGTGRPLSKGRRAGATKIGWMQWAGVWGRKGGEKDTSKTIFPVAADETSMNKERIKIRKTIPLNLL